MDFLRNLFSDENFMPHAHCYLYNTGLMALHVISDSLIFLSYFTIPFTLWYIVRKRRDLPFNWMFVAFGTFIIACGMTHLMEVWTLYHATYWVAGIIKAVTAMASVPTAILLVRLAPAAISLPSHSQLQEVHDTLQLQIQERERVEAANKMKDQFLAVLSHELRTPLTPVLTATQMLMDLQEMLPPKLQSYIEIVHRNAEIEVRLIDDLLDLTRIENNKIILQLQPLDLHQIVKETLETVEPEIKEKQLTIVLELQATKTMMMGDVARVRQILWNLIKNATKFTQEGGTIWIRSKDCNDRIQLQIVDNGIGIESGVLPRIFNAFEQGEKTITRRYGGLGLGLAISHSLADLHKGTLEAYSEGTGKGATFTLQFNTAPVN